MAVSPTEAIRCRGAALYRPKGARRRPRALLPGPPARPVDRPGPRRHAGRPDRPVDGQRGDGPVHPERLRLRAAGRTGRAWPWPCPGSSSRRSPEPCSTAMAGCAWSCSTTCWPRSSLGPDRVPGRPPAALPAWLLLSIAAVSSLTSPLSTAGLRSLFPILVPKPLWERANAADSVGYVLATVVGPPLAGVIVQVWGPAAALGFIGVVFVVAAAVMVGLPEPDVPAVLDRRAARGGPGRARRTPAATGRCAAWACRSAS